MRAGSCTDQYCPEVVNGSVEVVSQADGRTELPPTEEREERALISLGWEPGKEPRGRSAFCHASCHRVAGNSGATQEQFRSSWDKAGSRT